MTDKELDNKLDDLRGCYNVIKKLQSEKINITKLIMHIMQVLNDQELDSDNKVNQIKHILLENSEVIV